MDICRIFFLLLLCMVNGLANEQDKKTLVILDALKKYGAAKKPSNLGNAAKQYVSVTVLSQHEFANQSWLTNGQFPEDFSARLCVQYNEDNNKVHGEKIVLEKYLDGLIDEMKKNCENGEDTECRVLVFLFSWYIPCSLKKHVCAEKLQNSAKLKGYKLFVGFSKIFINSFINSKSDNTIKNFEDSFKKLDLNNIKVYYLVHYYSGSISKRSRFRKAIKSFSLDFQSNMYDCIIQSPVPFCCGSDYTKDNPESTNLSQIDKITALSINTMVNECNKSEILRTSHEKNPLWKDCFFKWTYLYIGMNKDCKKCFPDKKTYRDIVDICINISYATSKFIEESWYDNDLVGNNLSLKNKPQTSNNLPKCFKGFKLHPATFCTKNYNKPVEKSSDDIEEQNSLEKKIPEKAKKNKKHKKFEKVMKNSF